MHNLNYIQNEILTALKYLEYARFRDLNKNNLSTDLFSYHLKALQKQELIEKSSSNHKYSLTLKGQFFVGRLDEEGYKVQTKLHFSFVCKKKKKNEDIFYLIQKRTKAPYLGWLGFPSAKIEIDHLYHANANEKLKARTGLDGNIEFKGLHHILAKLVDKIVEDKSFFILNVTNHTGKLKQNTKSGENSWLSVKELKTLNNVFPDIDRYIEIAEGEQFQFYESVQNYKDLL